MMPAVQRRRDHQSGDPPFQSDRRIDVSMLQQIGDGKGDLEDDNGATCDSNIWTSNIFGTKSQACIN